MSKITMQKLADELNISRVTVWKAFNQQLGISDDLKKQIFEKAEELGYQHKKSSSLTIDASLNEKPTPFTVSVVVSRPESSLFWMNIIHQVAKELMQENINLLYTYIPSKFQPDFSLPDSFKDGSVKGLIILNVYDIHYLKLLDDCALPKVYLDYAPILEQIQLKGDLVLLEGKRKIREITSSLISSGIKRIGFIGDVTYAQTNLERYYGYLEAINTHGIPFDQSICLTSSIDIFEYEKLIFDYLKHCSALPEAFVCVSDFVANYVSQYMDMHSIDNIMITGFDASKEYGNLNNSITTVEVDTKSLGSLLASQLLFRIKNPNGPYVVQYMDTQILYAKDNL